MLAAICCWNSQQQSPPSSPVSPRSGQSATTCTCNSIDYNNEKSAAGIPGSKTTAPSAAEHCSNHQQLSRQNSAVSIDQSHEKDSREKRSIADAAQSDATLANVAPTPQPPLPLPHTRSRRQSKHGSISSSISSRSNYLRGFLSSKKSNADLSSPSSHSSHGETQPQSSPGKSPVRKFSLQKFYYPKNTMSVTAPPPSSPGAPSPTSPGSPATAFKSTPGSFSRMDMGTSGPLAPLAFEGPRTLGLMPASTPTSIPVPSTPPIPPIAQPPLLSLTMASETAAPSSTPTSIVYAERSLEPSVSPLSVAPLATPSPSPSLAFSVKPVSTSTWKTPTLATNLVLPQSPTSPPFLSISPSPPPSSLSLHPVSLSVLSTSYSSSSSSSSFSGTSSPNTSPSSSPTETSSGPLISSPPLSDVTPYPASGISPAKLAVLMERGEPSKLGVSTGPRPLVLDLRPNPDFDPASIVHSININLPTLLMRRYRRGGAVSSFALESFITMPSDKELYHLIQDGWRQDQDQHGVEVAHDIVVLDQDMKPGNEEFGRSPSPAWTLVNVLERGGGNCGGSIRLWYLEGGFEAFQAWDLREKYLMHPGSIFEMSVTQEEQGQQQDAEMTFAENHDGSVHPLAMPLSLPGSSTLSTSTFTDAKTAQAIDHAVSLTNASLGDTPRRGPPVRRESLFSLNTKSLQKPARLSRSQTIGVSALNIKPLSIPQLNTALHPLQERPVGNDSGLSQPLPPLRSTGSWLTVPTGISAPSLSPAMSLHSNPVELALSTSTDQTFMWSANSRGSSEEASSLNQQGPMLGSKMSISSSTTPFSLNHSETPQGIQEEDEDGGAGLHPFQTSSIPRHRSRGSFMTTSPFAPNASFFDANTPNNNAVDFQQEHQSQMFADGIDSYTNGSHSNNMFPMINHQGYDDQFADDGGDNGEQEISCILPNFLYLGPEIATEEQVRELERLGVKRVLNMARECEDLLVVNHPGIEYHKVGVQDHVEADVSTGLLQAVAVIAASNDSPIYVHCKAGKSRSVTAIIAYLITQLHWSLNKAYNHVLTQRPCMCPNIGFVTELMRVEERTLGTERAGGMARAGSLNSILSLSTAGGGSQSHHHHHHSLQHHHSLSMGGSPKVLSTKSSMNSLAILSPFQ